ncbi:MAG: metallophosphoesterase [Acutalibacteraceae bacterium]|nr:metallophosphoesterase [Acutalibacteraceae bacterium]
MSLKDKIRFKDGKLKVMQISDLQDTKNTSVDTLRFVDDAIAEVKPDLIIITGDQLDVVGLWGKGEKAEKNVAVAIRRLFSAIEKHNVPYVLTFGNHDRETGVSNEFQAKVYASLENCICFDDVNDGRPDVGTFNVPVKSTDGNSIPLNFFVMDTHSKTKGVGFEGVNDAQLDWYRKTGEELKAENGGEIVPSMVFQHIPVSNIMELFEEVPKGTKGSECDFVKDNKRYWILDEDKLFHNYTYGETPSMTLGTKQFDAMKAQGDVFAMYFGHDHYNSFAGKVDGIDLGYCPGMGYNSYGTKYRAFRVFEFDENDVKNYKTYSLNYKDCCGKMYTAPLKNSLTYWSPCNPSAAGPFAAKILGVAVPSIAALSLTRKYVSKPLVDGLLIATGVAAAVYAPTGIIVNKIMRNKKIKNK